MPELAVVIVATDNEQRTVLQVLVDGTSVARTAHTCASFPVAASDPIMRRVQAASPDVVLVDSAQTAAFALAHKLATTDLLRPTDADGQTTIYSTDVPAQFLRLAERFLGEKIESIRQVNVEPRT